MVEVIKMRKDTLKRAKVLEMVRCKKMTQKEAGEILGLSRRQVIRIYKRYVVGGEELLNHGLRGKPGNHRFKEELKREVIESYKKNYGGFGPTFACELLAEREGLKVSPSTLRLWLLKEGLWERKRKVAKHRYRRPRKEHFGEMVQMDGSIHDWFGEGDKKCLMNMVDDATGISFGLFDDGETTEVALRCLYGWVKRYGIPNAIYTDYKSLFYTKREASLEEQLAGEEALTEFGRVCKELGIEMIFASSPQAKGRVERHNGIHQDRLVKLFKLTGIKDCEQANNYLETEYWAKYNKKFGREPISAEDMHVPLTNGQNLNELICFCTERKIGRDYIVRKDNKHYQLTKGQKINLKPGDKVFIKTWLDGSVHIYKGKVALMFYEVDENGYKVAS